MSASEDSHAITIMTIALILGCLKMLMKVGKTTKLLLKTLFLFLLEGMLSYISKPTILATGFYTAILRFTNWREWLLLSMRLSGMHNPPPTGMPQCGEHLEHRTI